MNQLYRNDAKHPPIRFAVHIVQYPWFKSGGRFNLRWLSRIGALDGSSELLQQHYGRSVQAVLHLPRPKGPDRPPAVAAD